MANKPKKTKATKVVAKAKEVGGKIAKKVKDAITPKAKKAKKAKELAEVAETTAQAATPAKEAKPTYGGNVPEPEYMN